MTTTAYLQELIDQKTELINHIGKANVTAEEAEMFNTLIAKVGKIVEAPRIEYEYSGESITKANFFYMEEIPPYALYNQSGITNIGLYNCRIKSIGDYAFYANKISSFTIPNTVESIGKYAFYRTNITTIDIPSSVKSLGNNLFYYCEKLSSVTLPDTPMTLGSNLFAYTNLTSFTFPEWLTEIPSNFFYCCYNLNITAVPYGITKIGSSAFSATKSTFTEIPDSVTYIGQGAFNGLKSKILTIPSSVTSIYGKLLGRTATVETVKVYCNLPNCFITDSVNTNTSLKYVEVGGSTVDSYAFQGCTGLLKVWLRENVTTIKTATATTYKPFYGCTEVVIYAEADSKPDGWADDFNKLSTTEYAEVIYGVKESPF